MKKLTIIVALFFSVNCYSQNTTNPDDTLALVSKKQIEMIRQSLLKRLEPLEGTLTAAKYNGLAEGVNATIDELITLWNQEYSKKKKPK